MPIPRDDPLERPERPAEPFPALGIRAAKLVEGSQLTLSDITPDGIGAAPTSHGHLKHNLGADADPTASDDEASGYSIGSVWINISTPAIFQCVTAAAGAADWNQTDAIAAAADHDHTGGGDGGVLTKPELDDYMILNEISAPGGDPAANKGWLYVKDDGGTSGLYFEADDGTVTDLLASGGGSGTLTTIKENDAQVGGADIEILDFLGADFDLTESPDKEIQIVIAAAIARTSALHAEAHAPESHTGQGATATELEELTDASETTLHSHAGGGGNHNLLSTTHPDTLQGSVVRGDVLVGNATPKWSRLVLGGAGYYLRSDGTDIAYSTIQDGDVPGTHSGSAHHAQSHTVASHSDTTATGAELNTLTGGGETGLHSHAGGGGGDITTDGAWVAEGDLIKGTGANTAEIFSRGADHTILTSTGSTLAWVAIPPLAGIADIDDTTRIAFGTSSPHVVITGDMDVNGVMAVGNGGTVSAFVPLLVDQTTALGSFGFLYGVAITATDNGSDAVTAFIIAGLQGDSHMNRTAGGAMNAFGLLYKANYGAGGTFGTLGDLVGAQVGFSIASSIGAITTATAIRANIEFGGGSVIPTNVVGIEIQDLSKGVNRYGLKMGTVAGSGATIARLLDLGTGPTFRVLDHGTGGWAAAANETPLWIKEGVTPTLRQLKTKDGAAIGGGDLVCVLV